MYWEDQGYILSKTSYNENSLIIEAFTLNHGKCSGIVYGGSSRKQKKNFQIGNKIFITWRSKGENKKDSSKKSVFIDDKLVKVPDILLNNTADKISNLQIKEALIFNKFLILENFIKPHSLRLPFSRNILEKYFN